MSLITTKGAKASLLAAAFTLMPAAANAADALTLKADDYVGISFWLISMALVAATAFSSSKQPAYKGNGRHH